MTKKYSLVFIALLCSFFYGFGQIITFEFSGLTGNEATTNSNYNDTNLTNSTISRGSGLTASNNGGRFNATSWATSAAIGATDYMEFTVTPNSGYQFSVSSIFFQVQRSSTGPGAISLRNSLDGYTSNLDAEYSINDNTSTQNFTFTFTQANSNSLVTYRIYMHNAEAIGGSGGIGDGGGNDIIVNGTVSSTCTDTLDYYNLELPLSGSRTVGSAFNVYAKTYEPGVTNDGDAPDDAGTGIEAWIGYNTIDNNPSTVGWTWISASFNNQVLNDDVFVADIGSGLATGTYYYASRFRLNNCNFTYGVYDIGGGDGVWDGVNDVNGVLTVDQVDFCNLQFPEVGNIVSGDVFDVYARVFEQGVTEAAGQGAGIECWIGYSEIDATLGNSINDSNTRADFASSNWTWIQAGYNQDYGNDDEYFVDIGSCIPPGSYVYASRFRLNNGAYSYGGIEPPNGGNFWDGSTYISGTLTVTDPPEADVVITEIMYNSTGTDDEWIEICNVSGSTQDISNYIIDVGGSTEFTFPCNTTIADGDCITINLGDDFTAPFNPDCPFTADFISGNGTGTLNNSSDTIKLVASNGSTVADQVTYDSNDGGTVSSLHIIDIAQDNSVTSTNWQELDLGGSSKTNSLIPNCVPMVAEIRVDGNLGVFPNIPDDDTFANAPTGTNNTLFAAQFVGSTQSKSYRIQNLGGLDLTNSVTIIGANPGEFNVSGVPTSPVIYGTPSILEITFAPTTAGVKNAIVRIANNDDNSDGDTEEIYTFNIQGEGKCVGVIDNISPQSGPEGTVVTVSATGLDLSSAMASFNTIPVTILNYIVATDELEVTVPSGATDGNLEIIDGFGCTGFFAFDVIDNTIGGCTGGASITDLFISEVTDATTGGMTYIEIYNGTGSAVNLNGYSLEIIANGNASGNTLALNNVSLANDDTYIVAIGVASSPDTTDPGANTCPITGGNGQLADQTSTMGGINKKDNEHDVIRLVDSGGAVDEFGVYQDDDWMDSTIITGNRGFNFRRLATATPLPNPNFSLTGLSSNWNVIDWVGSGLTSCNTNDYSNIGEYDFSTGTPPTVDPSGPVINSSCNSATISISATEGYADSIDLTYQWFYSAPGDSGWLEIPNTAAYDYTSSTTDVLHILDTSGLINYQYYCEVREDDATCSTASDAVQLTLPTATWTGTWSSTPTPEKIAIIDADYNTGNGTNGQVSFQACNLLVNSGFTLTVANTNYVEVENNAIIEGNLVVQTQGSFVQNDNTGTFTLNGGTSQVNKTTAPLATVYNYTYWSSPVKDALIGTALFTANPNRLYYFDSSAFQDPDGDGVDDLGDDWKLANLANIMEVGRGYASTHSNIGFIPGNSYSYNFSGEFNTGTILEPLSFNPVNTINHWNLVGNPYPSAIRVRGSNSLFSENANTIIKHEVFMWSQYRPYLDSNPGNQNLNFSQDDYITINITGPVGNGSDLNGDLIPDVPDDYIPSGQSFFISSLSSTNLTFNNTMRISGEDANNQFFEANDSNQNINRITNSDERLWLNLISDNGAANQLLVGYINEATDGFDMGYDTKRNLTANSAAIIYTGINDISNEKFVIQGKNINSLNKDEIVLVGFKTIIDVPTIFTFSLIKYEGPFLENNTVYLKDNFMNTIHNLKDSDYNFTSEVGEFNNRFEIVFTEDALSIGEEKIDNSSLQIIELQNGDVQFKVSSQFEMKSIEITDLLGRVLYNLDAQGSSQTYSLSNLSQATYLAKVEFTNGHIITKKALKRK